MDSLTSEYRLYLGLAIIGLGAFFCGIHVWRSIKLKKGLSDFTIKMYMLSILATVLGVVGVSGVVTGDAVTALLGALAGYGLGNKVWEGANE